MFSDKIIKNFQYFIIFFQKYLHMLKKSVNFAVEFENV